MNQSYNIYLRKDGRYEGRIPVGRNPNGKIHYRSVYHRDKKKLMEIMASEMKKEQIKISSSKIKFNVLFDQWYQSKIGKVKESTLAMYRCHLDAHLRPLFGHKYISTMTSDRLNDLCSSALSQRSDGKGELATKTHVDILRTLNNILRFGVEKGYFSTLLQAEYPRPKPQKMNILRENELLELEKVLITNINKRDALGIYICLYTGIRVGELCGLQWDDIDLEQGILFIQRTVQRISVEDEDVKTKVMIGEPKTSSSKREIPIPDHLIPILTKIKPYQKKLFFLSDDTSCSEPRRIQMAFHRYLDLAGLPHRGIHCTRHTFATRWVECGVDIKTLSEILGHTGIRITLDKYVHISEKTKRENINKIQPLFSSKTGTQNRQITDQHLPLPAVLSHGIVKVQT